MNNTIAFLPGTGQDEQIAKLLKDWFPQSEIINVPILSPADKTKTLAEMADSATDWLIKNNWIGGVLIGYSIGGQIALSLAKKNKIKIHKLIMLSTPFDGNFFKPIHEKVLKLIFSKKGQPVFNWLMKHPKLIYNPLTVRLMYPKLIFAKKTNKLYDMDLNAETMPQWFFSLRQMQQQDFSEFLKTNNLPINVIYGDNDNSFLPGYYERWSQFPNVRLHKLPGDHNPVVDHPEMAKKLFYELMP